MFFTFFFALCILGQSAEASLLFRSLNFKSRLHVLYGPYYNRIWHLFTSHHFLCLALMSPPVEPLLSPLLTFPPTLSIHLQSSQRAL